MNEDKNTYDKKILIVDDEPYVLRVLKLKLEKAGYEVVTAVNGEDGLEKFISEKPSIIITDINMPHIDGQEMYQMMKEHEKSPFSVIVMTSSVEDSVSAWIKMTPSIHFVEKPFSPRNILSLVNKLFSDALEKSTGLQV